MGVKSWGAKTKRTKGSEEQVGRMSTARRKKAGQGKDSQLK